MLAAVPSLVPWFRVHGLRTANRRGRTCRPSLARAADGGIAKLRVVMPFEKKWYGTTEFAFTDPDGWVITFAERT